MQIDRQRNCKKLRVKYLKVGAYEASS